MIRVLRLIEYTYNDAKQAEHDMARWGIPAIGTRHIGRIGLGETTIKSTILTDLDFVEDSDE